MSSGPPSIPSINDAPLSLLCELFLVIFTTGMILTVYLTHPGPDHWLYVLAPFIFLVCLENMKLTTALTARILSIYPFVLLFLLVLVYWRRKKWKQIVRASTEASLGSLLRAPIHLTTPKEVAGAIMQWTILPGAIATLVGNYFATPKKIHLERDDWTPYLGSQAPDFWFDVQEGKKNNKHILDPRGGPLSCLFLTPRLGRGGGEEMPELVFPVVSVHFPFYIERDYYLMECVVDVWAHDEKIRCARNLYALASLHTLLVSRVHEKEVGMIQSMYASIFAVERIKFKTSTSILYGTVLTELVEFERHAVQEGIFKIVIQVPFCQELVSGDDRSLIRVSGQLTVVLGPCEWHTRRETLYTHSIPPLVLRHAVLNLA